jgi:hypothetical protein
MVLAHFRHVARAECAAGRGFSGGIFLAPRRIRTEEPAMKLLKVVKALLAGDRGEGLTEYAILIGTLALGAIVTLLAAGAKLHTVLAEPATRTALHLF